MKGHSTIRFKTQLITKKCAIAIVVHIYLSAFKVGNKRRRVNCNELVTSPDLKGVDVLLSSGGSVHVQTGLAEGHPCRQFNKHQHFREA